jgi:hypothetical protein
MKGRTLESIFVFWVICFLVSCTTLPRATEEDKKKSFTDVPYDQLFEAVKDTYQNLDLKITSSSGDATVSGYIWGESKSYIAWSPSGGGLFGDEPQYFYRYYRATISYSGTETNIQIEIHDEVHDKTWGTTIHKVNRHAYDEFWVLVQENLY